MYRMSSFSLSLFTIILINFHNNLQVCVADDNQQPGSNENAGKRFVFETPEQKREWEDGLVSDLTNFFERRSLKRKKAIEENEEIVLSPETKAKIQNVKDNDARKMLEEAFKQAEKEKKLREEREMYVNFTCGVNTIRNNLKSAYERFECERYHRKVMDEPKMPYNVTAKQFRELKYENNESRYLVKLFYQWREFLKENRKGEISTGLKFLELLQQYRGRQSIADITDEDIEKFALSLARNGVFGYKFREELNDEMIRRSADLQKENKKKHLFDLLHEMNMLNQWNFRPEDLDHLNILRQVLGFPPDLHAWFFQLDGQERGVAFISGDYCPTGFGGMPSDLRIH